MTQTTSRAKTREIFIILCIVIFVVSVLGYGGYEIRKMVTGPRISVLFPANGAVVSESLIEIVGNAKNIKEISLNDRKIFTDEEGNFKEEVLLSYGYNVMKVKASDRFGKEEEQIFELTYK